MTGKFEAHITCDQQYYRVVESIGQLLASAGHTWVYSQITGCPILGSGTYCHLSGFNTNPRQLKQDMDDVAQALRDNGVPVLRAKIEQIVYDNKTGINVLEEVDV